MDADIRGQILKTGPNSILFESSDGLTVWLPREQIAIIQEVEGVTVSMSERLARSKGFNIPFKDEPEPKTLEELTYGSL